MAERALHVLFGPFTRNTWGHLVRTLAVADVLASQGVTITFVCGREARATVRGAGYAHYVHDAMKDPQQLRGRSKRALRTAERHYAGELDALRICLRTCRPDVVVSDLQPLLNVAAALECIPSMSMLNLELLPAPLMEWLLQLTRILDVASIPRWATARMFGDALAVVDAPDAFGLRDLEPTMATAITSSVREVRFVGPIIRDLPLTTKRRAAKGRPTVVISLGGSGGRSILEFVLRGCAAVDADFVVVEKSPSKQARTAARAMGDRARIVGFLPDFGRVIRDADALISHGGHGTLLQALCLAVPTLVVPMTVERQINSKRLRLVGQSTSPIPSQIEQTIGGQLEYLLHDRSRDRSRASRAAYLRSYGAAKDVAFLVRQLAVQ